MKMKFLHLLLCYNALLKPPGANSIKEATIDNSGDKETNTEAEITGATRDLGFLADDWDVVHGCNKDKSWCKKKGGPGAYAKGSSMCYDDFLEDCMCEKNYVITPYGCEKRVFIAAGYYYPGGKGGFIGKGRGRLGKGKGFSGNGIGKGFSDDGIFFGKGVRQALPDWYFFNDAGYDDAGYDDAGYYDAGYYDVGYYDAGQEDVRYDDRLRGGGGDYYGDYYEDDDIDCHSMNPDRWCRREGGPGAKAKKNKRCWNNFNNDCKCMNGYEKKNKRCRAL